MRSQTRSGLSTVLWLTFYVGVLPTVAIILVMFTARRFFELDESWGIVWGAAYLVLLFAGANYFARHFERRGG